MYKLLYKKLVLNIKHHYDFIIGRLHLQAKLNL